MAQEKQETREEEVARVRSYLASQAMRRTAEQLVETLHQQRLKLRDLITAFRDSSRQPFPNWKN